MKNLRTTTQDLGEAFASIISMMLGVLRAQGLRGLIHLPEIVLVVFLLRSISKRFAALMAAHAAGTLLLPATPAPSPRQLAPAQPRHRSARQLRRSLRPARAKRARAGEFVRPWVRPYPTRNPKNRPGPRAGILVTARST
jgi:hypothetical protein